MDSRRWTVEGTALLSKYLAGILDDSQSALLVFWVASSATVLAVLLVGPVLYRPCA